MLRYTQHAPSTRSVSVTHHIIQKALLAGADRPVGTAEMQALRRELMPLRYAAISNAPIRSAPTLTLTLTLGTPPSACADTKCRS